MLIFLQTVVVLAIIAEFVLIREYRLHGNYKI